MAKLRCVVERITFQSPETGYTVLKARVKDYTELVAVVGNLLDANVGSVLLVAVHGGKLGGNHACHGVWH